MAEVTGKAFRIESEPDGIRQFKRPRTGRFALLALVALTGAAAFVVFGLPELVKPDKAVAPIAEPPANLKEAVPEQKPSPGSDARSEAENRLAEALRGLARMEGAGVRSEEHTSELQSLMRISYAVFCLQKKKTYLIHKTQYGDVQMRK